MVPRISAVRFALSKIKLYQLKIIFKKIKFCRIQAQNDTLCWLHNVIYAKDYIAPVIHKGLRRPINQVLVSRISVRKWKQEKVFKLQISDLLNLIVKMRIHNT